MQELKNFISAIYIDYVYATIFIGKINDQPAIYMVTKRSLNLDIFLKKLKEVKVKDKRFKLNTTIDCQPHLTYPASKAHIDKLVKNFKYTAESYEDYLSNCNFLTTNWLDNIINSRGTGENVFFEDDVSMIISDYKWDLKSADQLYLLMIFKDPKLRSIRDIDDYNLLVKAKQNILKVCKEEGLAEKDVSLYFHYRPSYFRLHIHIVNISKSIRYLGSPTRNVFLDDVIYNLKLDCNYYKKDCYFIGFE